MRTIKRISFGIHKYKNKFLLFVCKQDLWLSVPDVIIYINKLKNNAAASPITAIIVSITVHIEKVCFILKL